MLLARVTGTVTATAKDAQMVGSTLLVCDIANGAGKSTTASVVAVDTVGAGVGDDVLITTGSAARMAAGSAGSPVDATIIAVVDTVTVAK
jgi:microcompartment protein CcmK/EutM